MAVNPKGYLIDIQHYSVNDGDGIRSTVFFAGCNLRCQWCANPESFTTFDKILHTESSCVRCGRCADICPYGVGMNLSDPEERSKCKSCGRCVPVCPTGSRRSAIRVITVEELLEEIEKYALFYRYSGGGVTFSGGEATAQFDFLDAASRALYDAGVDLCMESNGWFDPKKLAPVLDRLDLLFLDLKLVDTARHRSFTGAGNEEILATIRTIGQSTLPLVVRVPVIESVNADDETIRSMARFVKENTRDPRMELLPYHAYGDVKYRALGRPAPSVRFQTPSAEKMASFEEILREEGVRVEHF